MFSPIYKAFKHTWKGRNKKEPKTLSKCGSAPYIIVQTGKIESN